jgi:hypothetical protein
MYPQTVGWSLSFIWAVIFAFQVVLKSSYLAQLSERDQLILRSTTNCIRDSACPGYIRHLNAVLHSQLLIKMLFKTDNESTRCVPTYSWLWPWHSYFNKCCYSILIRTAGLIRENKSALVLNLSLVSLKHFSGSFFSLRKWIGARFRIYFINKTHFLGVSYFAPEIKLFYTLQLSLVL